MTALLASGAQVLLFSAYEQGALLLEAVRAGAQGYLEDGELESAPMVGGIPGFEYCSG